MKEKNLKKDLAAEAAEKAAAVAAEAELAKRMAQPDCGCLMARRITLRDETYQLLEAITCLERSVSGVLDFLTGPHSRTIKILPADRLTPTEIVIAATSKVQRLDHYVAELQAALG